MSSIKVSTLGIELATRLVEAARAAAEARDVPSSVAVVDRGGNLVAFAKMDGAALLTSQVAQDKAYTAAGFGMATDEWHDFIKDDGPLAVGAPTGIQRLIVFGGGEPIRDASGDLLGGLGLSGGHWTQDKEIALEALQSVAQ